jgi:hypothetical protein
MIQVEAIALVVNPFIVSGLIGLLKKLIPADKLNDAGYTAGVRLLGAFISLLYILLGMYATHTYDTSGLSNALNAFELTFVTWVSSLGIYHGIWQAFLKRKTVTVPTS